MSLDPVEATFNFPVAIEQSVPVVATYPSGAYTGSGFGEIVDGLVIAVDLALDPPQASTSGCEASDFAGLDFSGDNDIALVQRGTCFFSEKAVNAEAKPKPVPTSAPKTKVLINGETFSLGGKEAFVMLPAAGKEAAGKPWIFYGPTLPPYPDVHESWMHGQFVEAGIAVAGIDVGEAFGSPQAFPHFESLYQEMVERGFSKKPVLLGRSRGGLWVSSWAIAHPERVTAIAGGIPSILSQSGLSSRAKNCRVYAEKLSMYERWPSA